MHLHEIANTIKDMSIVTVLLCTGFIVKRRSKSSICVGKRESA